MVPLIAAVRGSMEPGAGGVYTRNIVSKTPAGKAVAWVVATGEVVAVSGVAGDAAGTPIVPTIKSSSPGTSVSSAP
jgi:hypothetical protein